jgi:hypothetical protein
VVVLGDFWQLGAVRQAPVYKSSSSSSTSSGAAAPSNASARYKADADAGHEIWLQLTNGVELVTNMRAAQDKPFAVLLGHLRVNQHITQLQLDVFNSGCAITPTRQPPAGTHARSPVLQHWTAHLPHC